MTKLSQLFVWIVLNVLPYHALSADRSDLKEMKEEIQTISEKLIEGTDFITGNLSTR